MILNIAFDFLIGLVPFLGDIIDAAYKANSRNAALLESHLREKGQKNLRQTGQPVPAEDPSLSAVFDQEELNPSQDYAAQQPAPSAPEPARTKESRGYLGRNKTRPADEEMAHGGEPSRSKSKKLRSSRA